MDIQDSFDDSLRNTTLPDTVIDIAEMSIDMLIKDEALRELPIVKTFVGLIQAGVNIHDLLFLKKIISFLKDIDGIEPTERKQMIDDIDGSRKYRLKVGEKLLYVIDSCDDYEAAERVAKLFSAVLQKKISYDEYLEAASIIVRLSKNELLMFLDSYNAAYMDEEAAQLIHTGLVFSEAEPLSVDIKKPTTQEWFDGEADYEADTMGGEVTLKPTYAGDTIYHVFGMGKEARRAQMDEERKKRIAGMLDKAVHKNT